MRTRRRGRRAAWTYANAGSMELGGAIANITQYVWLMPPGRAQYLADAKSRDSITFVGAQLWLDFHWENRGSAASLVDVDFCVYKATIVDPVGNLPDFSPIESQWEEPPTPASLTAWEEDTDDGNYGFLWQHHIKGTTPANAQVVNQSTSNAWNQTNIIGAGTSDSPAWVCRKFYVTQEWQPDVVIRSKRRLAKGEGILLACRANFSTATLFAKTDYHYRVLTK